MIVKHDVKAAWQILHFWLSLCSMYTTMFGKNLSFTRHALIMPLSVLQLSSIAMPYNSLTGTLPDTWGSFKQASTLFTSK